MMVGIGLILSQHHTQTHTHVDIHSPTNPHTHARAEEGAKERETLGQIKPNQEQMHLHIDKLQALGINRNLNFIL